MTGTKASETSGPRGPCFNSGGLARCWTALLVAGEKREPRTWPPATVAPAAGQAETASSASLRCATREVYQLHARWAARARVGRVRGAWSSPASTSQRAPCCCCVNTVLSSPSRIQVPLSPPSPSVRGACAVSTDRWQNGMRRSNMRSHGHQHMAGSGAARACWQGVVRGEDLSTAPGVHPTRWGRAGGRATGRTPRTAGQLPRAAGS